MRTGRDLHILAKDPHLWQEDTCLYLCLRACACVGVGIRCNPRLELLWAHRMPQVRAEPLVPVPTLQLCGCNLTCTCTQHTF